MESADKVKKRRTRKKAVEIDSVDKLNIASSEPPTIKNEECEVYSNKEDVDHVKTPFGKLMITEIKSNNAMTDEEIDEYFAKKFGINEADKSSKLIMQDESNVVYEPVKEERNPKKKSSGLDQEGEKDKARKKKSGTKKADKKHRILCKFIDNTKKEWPKETDVFCWWCCHSFDTPPVPCPHRHDRIKSLYSVNGVFCGWSCAAAYSIEKYCSMTLVQQMKNELEDSSEDIEAAPSRYVLKRFGGHMNIKDFRGVTGKKIVISTEKVSYINQDIAEMM